MKKVIRCGRVILPVLFFVAVLKVPTLQAVPSYARQTGLPCSGCHYTPPELNGAGRDFKLRGYTQKKQDSSITAEAANRYAALDILASLPVSAMIETSYTSTRKAQPGTQNGNFEFPQDVSLFLSGAWSSHVGSFVQVTYDTQDDHFSMDNTEIRIANAGKLGGKDFIYGATFNNNPSLEDLWNDTPAWGFPWIASDVAPTPSAGPIVDGALAQDVAGLGGYAMWNNHLYAAGTLYRSAHVGGAQPNSGEGFAYNIRGLAPYWRVAWQQTGEETQFEVGTFGMYMKSSPNAVTGPEDRYTDVAGDFQIDRTLFRTDTLSLRGSYISETSDLAATYAAGGAAQTSHHLRMAQANAEYHFGDRYSATVAWFNTTGTADPLLFAQDPVVGSANGDPRSGGFTGNISWWPAQNVQFALQYTAYTKFNGGSSNYDGAGRSASDNNTTYVLGRFLF